MGKLHLQGGPVPSRGFPSAQDESRENELRDAARKRHRRHEARLGHPARERDQGRLNPRVHEPEVVTAATPGVAQGLGRPHHVVEDPGGTGRMLGGVQTQVGIAGAALCRHPEGQGRKGAHARIGIGHDGGIDAGTAKQLVCGHTARGQVSDETAQSGGLDRGDRSLTARRSHGAGG